jgi:formyl-CoA transferase
MAALDGLRILDMTQWEAGTAASQSLAFLGADVVKVEQPQVGDPGRYQGAKSGTDSAYFINWNSNKRSVTIDLSKPAGREILLNMLPNYDVFIENYGPGVIEKLDLGYEVMKKVHPEVIYARIKGFGTSGPYADYKCMDMVAQAAASAFSITGEREGPPMRPGPTTGDAGTGVQMALAIAAAYVQKLRTGKGQLIEISMQEAMTYYLRTAVSYNDWGGRATPRNGNGNNPFVNLYPCKPGGYNDYVFIMAINPRMWQNLCDTIGKPGLLEEPRFKEMADRRKNLGALRDEIESWTLQHTKDEAMQLIAQAGVPASKVFDTRDLFEDPHLQERGFIHEIDHPVHGKVPLLGWPARMSGSHADIIAAPQLGEHTAEVMASDLGMTEEKIQEFRQQGVLGSENLLDQ